MRDGKCQRTTVLVVLAVVNAIAIVAVDHEDDALSVLIVVAPQRSNFVLATDVPHSEADVLVLDGLDVET